MYDVLNVCLDVIVALGQGYCLQYFLGSFLEGREKDRRINGLLVIMGHSDIGTTMNIYAEATENKKQEAFKNLEGKIKIG